MDDASIVGVPQRPAGLDADLCHLAPVESPPVGQLLLEAAPVDQFHDVEEMFVLLAESEQPHDVWVIQLPQGLDLGLEPLAESLFLGQGGGEELDGRRLVRFEVHPLVDGPHAAAAQLAYDPVWSELLDFHADFPDCAATSILSCRCGEFQ